MYIDGSGRDGLLIKTLSNKYGLRLRKFGAGNAIEVGQQTSDINFAVKGNGSVGIGTDGVVTAGYLLDVAGKIQACEIKVSNPGWCDYVFEDGYQLMPILQLEKYIDTYNHLPDVPSTAEVEENGIELAKMNAILLKKIEELTLYMIQMQKEIDALKN